MLAACPVHICLNLYTWVSFLSVALRGQKWGGGARWENISQPLEQLTNYPFTSREWDSENIYAAVASCNPALMVISSADAAAETLWSWAVCAGEGTTNAASALRCWRLRVSALNWYQGAGYIHLLKSSHRSAASHCCVIESQEERGERRVARWMIFFFCCTHILSSSWFYSPLLENHLCSTLVVLLLFAALVFHYLYLSFSPSPFIALTGFSFSLFLWRFLLMPKPLSFFFFQTCTANLFVHNDVSSADARAESHTLYW